MPVTHPKNYTSAVIGRREGSITGHAWKKKRQHHRDIDFLRTAFRPVDTPKRGKGLPGNCYKTIYLCQRPERGVAAVR